jgi:hypothetical protein
MYRCIDFLYRCIELYSSVSILLVSKNLVPGSMYRMYRMYRIKYQYTVFCIENFPLPGNLFEFKNWENTSNPRPGNGKIQHARNFWRFLNGFDNFQ